LQAKSYDLILCSLESASRMHVPEIRELLAALQNEARASGRIAFSGFLSRVEWTELANHARAADSRIFFFGGYPEAEKRMAALPANSGIAVDFGQFPIVPLLLDPLEGPIQMKKLRKDITALLAGFDPRLAGDLMLAGDSAALFTTIQSSSDILQSIAANFEGKLKCVLGTTCCLSEYRPELETISVAGNRLDALIAAAFRLNREDAKLAIQHGYVSMDLSLIAKPSKGFTAGNTVSLRDCGKIKIVNIGNARSGRLRVLVERYP